MNKILILGPCGAGKSTFSQKLSHILNIPVLHLDKLFWKPGWVMTDPSQWNSLLKKKLKKNTWIMDGNYGDTLDIRLPEADTVIFLNFSRYLCVWRVIKRIITSYGRTRPDMGEGCTERWDWGFIKYVWNFPKHEKPRVFTKLKKHQDDINILTFNSPSALNKFLLSL